MDTKIAAIRKASSIFLAILMFTGTIALSYPSSSFMMGAEEAQAQPYYDDNNDVMDNSRYNSYEPTTPEYSPKYTDKNSPKYEYPPKYTDRNSYYNNYESTTTSEDYGKENNYRNSYEKNNDNYDVSSKYPSSSYKPNNYKPAEYPSSQGVKDNNNYYKSQKDSSSSKKSVSLNKIKCINDNLNIDGENTGNITIGNKGTAEGYLSGYSSGGSGYGGGEGYYDNGYNKKKDKGIDCIINNNNTNTNIGGGGNQTIPPEPSKATLNVTKVVTCEDTTLSVVAPIDRCATLEQLITEDQFLIEVTDDNPIPSQFPGSESGTVVTLGAGNYVVTETDDPSVLTDLGTLLQQFNQGGGGPFFIQRAQSLTGDCTQVLLGGQATGTIGAGESQTCDIENSFTIGRQMT